MRRREFITLLGSAAVVWPREVTAQQAGKVYRIGILETISPAKSAHFWSLLIRYSPAEMFKLQHLEPRLPFLRSIHRASMPKPVA